MMSSADPRLGHQRHASEPALPGAAVEDPEPSSPSHEQRNASGKKILKTLKKAFSFGDTSLDENEQAKGEKEHAKTPTKSNLHYSPLQRALSFGKVKTAGLHGGAGVRWYHNLFPLRQKFEPRVEYPLWDENWDGNQNLRRRLMAEWAAGKPPEYVVARHIFLIRHGQYHEQHQEDEKRTLTLLGKQQAKKTGERLASIIQHNNKSAEEQSRVKVFVSSDMTRAKETADIIHKELEEMYIRHNADHPEDTWELFCRSDPDPNLNEGFPVHRIPGPKGFRDLHSNDIDRDFPRIEKAFLKYIGTSKWLDQHFEKSDAKGLLSGELIPEEVATTTTYSPRHNLRTVHEYEIIVGHANVTRYFICRALQIPPESWLRMNLYHCSMSYLVVNTNGSVTARMIGDNGHIPYEDASVDGSTVGFNWE